MALEIKKTDSENEDFIALVRLLDKELAVRDGDDHAFYDQFNKLKDIKHVTVLYKEDEPVGCGAIKLFDTSSMEIKRMFVKENHRGKGLAVQLLNTLEAWARDLGFDRCILETGFNQPEAIALYKKCNYQVIENYGQYAGVKTSICFEKLL